MKNHHLMAKKVSFKKDLIQEVVIKEEEEEEEEEESEVIIVDHSAQNEGDEMDHSKGGNDNDDDDVVWISKFSEKHKRKFYYNIKTKTSTWIKPENSKIV